MKIEVSIGDYLDRYSILAIKKLNGLEVDEELKSYQQHSLSPYLMILKSINRELWKLEDVKRKGVERYSKKESDTAFLITQLNDLRHLVKKKADVFHNSKLSEKKSYV